MAKITDVARLAGVSPSTVSHVLNGKRPISLPTRERVLAAIEELHYTPDANARALKSDRTGIIGFFAADITELFVIEIVRGVESVIVPAGDHLLLVSGSEFGGSIRKALEFLQSRRIDGIIVSYGVSQVRKELDFALPNMPMITINSDLNPRVPSIMPDNYKGGFEAAQHLASAGCRNAAIIAGPKNRPASSARIKGFLETAAGAGLTIDPAAVVYEPFTFEGGRMGMHRLLAGGKHFDGLFCANDYIAAGAMTAASNAGISVPSELKIVGFDDREFAAFWPTPITTFTQPLFSMGQMAARYLRDFLEEGSSIPRQTMLTSTLVVRESSGG
jgi:LacI family transcriptional regulator